MNQQNNQGTSLSDYIQQQHKNSDNNLDELQNLTCDDLCKLAEDNYETMNYDKSKIFFEMACEKDPQNERALTSYGYFLSNIRDFEKAKTVLTEAIYLNPHLNPKKYLYMAEIYGGEESVLFYTKAIEILQN